VSYLRDQIEEKIKSSLCDRKSMESAADDYTEYEKYFEELDLSNQRAWMHQLIVYFLSLVAFIFTFQSKYDLTQGVTTLSGVLSSFIWFKFLKSNTKQGKSDQGERATMDNGNNARLREGANTLSDEHRN